MHFRWWKDEYNIFIRWWKDVAGLSRDSVYSQNWVHLFSSQNSFFFIGTNINFSFNVHVFKVNNMNSLMTILQMSNFCLTNLEKNWNNKIKIKMKPKLFSIINANCYSKALDYTESSIIRKIYCLYLHHLWVWLSHKRESDGE